MPDKIYLLSYSSEDEPIYAFTSQEEVTKWIRTINSKRRVGGLPTVEYFVRWVPLNPAIEIRL